MVDTMLLMLICLLFRKFILSKLKFLHMKRCIILPFALVAGMSAAWANQRLVQDSVDLQPYDLSIEEDEAEGTDSLALSEMPIDVSIPAAALYGHIWNHAVVNPYNISVAGMKDTVPIDMSGYTHPRLNYITSKFGFRRWKFHYGIDVKVYVGDSIRSAFDGRVRIAKRGKAYGNYIVVRHYNGLETTYAHLSKINVQVNDEVKSGDVIGLGGNTGRSTGPHLHYEMRYLGQPIDPATLIDFETGRPYTDSLQLTASNFEYMQEIAKMRYWVVRSGDSLWNISRRTGVSVDRLCKLNGISSKSILRLGQRVRYT